jgi:DNA replication protein DnaC
MKTSVLENGNEGGSETMMINQTMEQLGAMKLNAMSQEYRRQQELSAMQELPFDDRFGMIVDNQWRARKDSKIKKLIKVANLKEPSACLENIDYDPVHNIAKVQIAQLSDCQWIQNGLNLIVTGLTGTGKTYLMSAFGREACMRGYSVKTYRVNRLLTDLAIGRGDGSYNKLIQELKKPDLLILDDFGMAAIEPSACRDLLEVIDERYGRKSIAISAQLPVSKWIEVFTDATIADAILDRIVHNAYRLYPQGPSKRTNLNAALEEPKKKEGDKHQAVVI